MTDLDHCPECGRRITDHDMTGCERDDGQRYCMEHLPPSHLYGFTGEAVAVFHEDADVVTFAWWDGTEQCMNRAVFERDFLPLTG